MKYHETKAKSAGFQLVVGIDEVGRGPLAGPVVSCAINLKKYKFKNRIDDSKKLSENQRLCAFLELTADNDFGIGIVNERGIDQLNILQATRISMQNALADLGSEPDFALVDGEISLDVGIPYKKIIGGDSKSLSIAAASIVAKVIRDRIMYYYDRIYPKYGFRNHKGYGTREHFKAIKKYGPCPIHRLSFYPFNDERKP